MARSRTCALVLVLWCFWSVASATEEHETRHLLKAFVGNTHTHDDDNGLTLGVGYEYRLTPLLAVSALGEYAGGQVDTWVVGPGIVVYPYKRLSLVAMPAVELHGDGSEFLFRLGVGYEFEASEKVVVIPEMSVDFVDSETNLVFGVNIGIPL